MPDEFFTLTLAARWLRQSGVESGSALVERLAFVSIARWRFWNRSGNGGSGNGGSGNGDIRYSFSKTVCVATAAATDRQIDRLVYELYGLTAKEIKIVEEGSR